MPYAAERRVLQTLLTHVEEPLQPYKLPQHYAVQWAVQRGPGMIAGWAECQHRRGKHSEDSAVPVDIKRWKEGCELAKATSKPFLIVVEWDDGLFYVRSDEVARTYFGFGGVPEPDLESPCIFIPTNVFIRPEERAP